MLQLGKISINVLKLNKLFFEDELILKKVQIFSLDKFINFRNKQLNINT